MKVEEFIKILQKMDQDKQIEFKSVEKPIYGDTQSEATFVVDNIIVDINLCELRLQKMECYQV